MSNCYINVTYHISPPLLWFCNLLELKYMHFFKTIWTFSGSQCACYMGSGLCYLSRLLPKTRCENLFLFCSFVTILGFFPLLHHCSDQDSLEDTQLSCVFRNWQACASLASLPRHCATNCLHHHQQTHCHSKSKTLLDMPAPFREVLSRLIEYCIWGVSDLHWKLGTHSVFERDVMINCTIKVGNLMYDWIHWEFCPTPLMHQ